MADKYIEQIMQAYEAGVLNKCMAKRLMAAAQGGMTDELFEEVVQDARDASDLGVKDDTDYTVYFFVNRLADDLLDDTFGMKVSPERKRDLCRYILSHRGEDYALDDLTDYRLLTHKWLCDKLSDKKAHPNISGKENREPTVDLDKWISTLKKIYGSLHNKKMDRPTAIDHFTLDWDLDERQRFINWMRYYEDGTTEKYNVKNAKLTKQAFGADLSVPQAWLSQEDRANDTRYMSTYKADDAKAKTKREKELENARSFKSKMRSRLRSLKRLVDKYNDILPNQSLEHVYDEIHSLEKSISKLNVYASMQDCVIRSANRIEKFGFKEGADFLRKTAEPPAVGQDVVESLPEGETNVPDLPDSAPKFTITTIIDRLEGVSRLLKSRDMIRELASIDILLNELGMASYFPELTDAQSKMIESFGYASNKIESIVAKLRGSGSTGKLQGAPKSPPTQPPAQQPPAAPKAPAKPIDTKEIMDKPVGEVQKELPVKPER